MCAQWCEILGTVWHKGSSAPLEIRRPLRDPLWCGGSWLLFLSCTNKTSRSLQYHNITMAGPLTQPLQAMRSECSCLLLLFVSHFVRLLTWAKVRRSSKEETRWRCCICLSLSLFLSLSRGKFFVLITRNIHVQIRRNMLFGAPHFCV